MNTFQKLFPFAFKPKTNTMNKPHTLYHIVLDRSGSMSDCLTQTLSGFKEQVQSIRALQNKFPEQHITLGVSMFNDEVKHVYFNENPEKANILTRDTYVPNGNTALYDAIVLTANRIENDLIAQKAQENTTVVMVIITDGYENSSKHYRLSDVRSTINRLENAGKWSFNFIGATLDAVEVAETMHFKRERSMRIDKEEMNEEVWNKLDNYMMGYMNEKKMKMSKNETLDNIQTNLTDHLKKNK
jgi:hypothetical protein